MLSYFAVQARQRKCKRLPAAAFFWSLFLFLICGSLATYASVPAVVGSTSTSLPTVTTDTNMVVADVATDSAGNIFVATAFNWGDGGTITKLPANGGAPQQIAAGLGPLWGLSVGSDGSIYFTDRWNNHVEKIQYLGDGAYGSPTNLFSQIGNLSNWWFGGSDLAVDSTGAIYLSYEWGGGIDKVVNQAGTWTGTHIIGSSPAGEIKHIVLDKNNNIYFTTDSDTGAFMIKAGTVAPDATAVAIGTGLLKPSSIAVDDAGNVFIVDSGHGRVVEIPVVNGVLSATDQFTLAGGLTVGAISNLAVLPGGNLAFDDGAITLGKLSFAGYDLGASKVGTASATTATVAFVFNADATPIITLPVKGSGTSEFASSGGSTCVSGVARVTGDICTVEVAFTPNRLGERDGAVVLSNANGVALTSFPVSGEGTGPGLIVDPGAQSATSDASNFSKPQAVALDGAGNVYVADSGLTEALMLAAGGGAPQPVGSGLVNPSGIAVDSAGNVYIADIGGADGAGRIVVVPNENGSLKTADQFVFYSGLKNPSGLAVDRFNVVYVADTGNARVLKLIKNAFGVVNATLVGSGFKNPVGVAVDSDANVFVADGTAGILYEVKSSDGTQVFVMTGFGSAGGLAVDAAGSVYIADSVNHVVSRIPLLDGTFSPNSLTWIGSGFVAPQGVAIDAVGNAYVADMNKPGVFTVLRSQGVIDFGQFATGAHSDTFVSKLYNFGNEALTVASYSGAGDTGDFTVSDPAVCPSPLKPGFTCNLSSSFQPTSSGARQEVVTINVQDNAAPAIQETFKGEGVDFAASTITIAMTTPAPPGHPNFGAPATFSATVAAESGSTVPTGNVVFAIDGTPQQPVTLAAGMATFTTSAMTGGTHSITATYKGDGATFASSITTSALTVTVDPAIANAVVLANSYSYGVASTYNTNDGLILKAKVTTAIKTVPTGTVHFFVGTTEVGHASVSSGLATTTLSNSDLVGFDLAKLGTYELKAVYNGDETDTNFDPNFLTATSPVISIVATPEPTFDVASDITSMTVKPGDTGVYHVTINPKYNFGLRDRLGNVAAITFTCQDTTALTADQVACLFTVAGTGSSTQTLDTATATPVGGVFPSVTLQLTTIGPNKQGVASLAPQHRSGAIFLAMLAPGFLGLVGLATGRKKRLAKIIGTILLLATLAVMMSACGASNSNIPLQQTTNKGTQAGERTITVKVEAPAIPTNDPDVILSPMVDTSMTFKLTVR